MGRRIKTWAGESKHGPENQNMGRRIKTWAGESKHGPAEKSK
ncbi:hypothetical protein [Lentibacillus sp. CBA3610]|nr:hypothetical protein [Lentibacillus sp. CBA3610]